MKSYENEHLDMWNDFQMYYNMDLGEQFAEWVSKVMNPIALYARDL